MSSSQLIEIADKVFWNRDTEIEKKDKKRYKDEQRTDERFAMLAAALGNSSEHFSTAKGKNTLAPEFRGQDSPAASPNGGPGPRYRNQRAWCRVLATGRMNALRQGRKRKLPQLWGLLTWKLTRAARAQRYQVPKSPW